MRNAIFLLLLCLPVFAGDFTKITVNVTNESGKPLDRANVVVKFSGGRSIAKLGRKVRTSWEMRTTQEGVAQMPELPKGKILIQVLARNYQTYGEVFDIDDDEKTIDVTMHPPQKQYSAH